MIETKEVFLCVNMEKMDKIISWLNDLVDNDCSQGKIISIIDWQVVPAGRPYEYSAFARVAVATEF